MNDLIREAWRAVAADAARPKVEVTGTGGELASNLDVEGVAVGCVVTALGAAVALQEARGRHMEASVDRSHVAAAVRSERYLTRGGASAGMGFASLSRFWPTADGWVRTHANYPWHRAALLDALDVDDQGVAGAMADRTSTDIEDAVFAAGGVTAAVRTTADWITHPQGQAVSAEPLVSHVAVGTAGPRPQPSGGERPAAGVRVLDLTRVIAGPVCTRFLGALGADVLRLDPPHRPDMSAGETSDTLFAKRSAFLDLSDQDTLHQLLDAADVVVTGYRPGALERFGLGESQLVDRHPGLVIVSLDAWGHTGPWAGRRGFDSIVQAPSGIAMLESGDGQSPAALPCQLLDHGTGYLAAAAVLDGLRRRLIDGGTHIRRLSLARTALWLSRTTAEHHTSSPDHVPSPDQAARWIIEIGGIGAVRPPGSLDGLELTWPGPPARYGADLPVWW